MSWGSRDPGTLFGGESLQLDLAVNVTGAPITGSGSALFFANPDSNTETVTGGDEFVGYVYPELLWAMVGDVAEVSWVLVVTSGSASLRLHEGLDATFGSGGPSAATDLLGTFTASAGTLVVPSGISLSDIGDETGEPILRVECLSGSIELNQIKLRVWPPGGYLGSWDFGTSYETLSFASQFARVAENLVTPSAFYSDADLGTVWGQLETDLKTQMDVIDGTTIPFNTTPLTAMAQAATGAARTNPAFPWDSDVDGFLTIRPAHIRAILGYASDTTSGVVGIFPDSVPQEPGASVRGFDGLALPEEFGHWADPVVPITTSSTQPYAEPGGALAREFPWADLALNPGFTAGKLWEPSGGGMSVPSAVGASVPAGSITLPDVPEVQVYVYPPSRFSGTAPVQQSSTDAGAHVTITATLTSVSFYKVIPDHLWWNPLITVPPPLRQYPRPDDLALGSERQLMRSRTTRQSTIRQIGHTYL